MGGVDIEHRARTVHDVGMLRDLAEYKTYKNKNVSVAARALITLFRQMNPKLLHRKDRGRQVVQFFFLFMILLRMCNTFSTCLMIK